MRWKMAFVASAVVLAAVPAFAQTVPDTTSNTPASDAVGPRELQNFSLPGTTTKPAEQPPAVSAAPSSAPRAPSRVRATPPAPVAAERQPERKSVREKSASIALSPQTPVAAPQKEPAPTLSPPLSLGSVAAPPFRSAPVPITTTRSPGAVAPDHRLPILPWLIAAVALAMGGALLFWRRNRQRGAFAAGAQYDVAASEPPPAAPRVAPRAIAPGPQPAPVPTPVRPLAEPTVPAPRQSGIVASRLRPSIELAMQPLRCLVDDDQVTIEFEVELYNSGSAPARAVIAEASLFNASSSQEQELAAFYAKPPGLGERIDSIPPMRRLTFTNRVVAPRAQVQEYELAGRKSFVPVLAFNARYEWSGGKGQSALAYLLGRETRGDKLGPLHLDGARRELGGLGARVLPTAVRT